jgi:hypothetical protein
MIRFLRCWIVLMLMLSCLGCGALTGPFFAQDKSLRKQVEADSFPTAKQAGL